MNYIPNVLLVLAIIAFILLFISLLLYTVILKFRNKCRLLEKLFTIVISILVLDIIAIILAMLLLESVCLRNILIN